jgi:hypothetical protein
VIEAMWEAEEPAELDHTGQHAAFLDGAADRFSGGFIVGEHAAAYAGGPKSLTTSASTYRTPEIHQLAKEHDRPVSTIPGPSAHWPFAGDSDQR